MPNFLLVGVYAYGSFNGVGSGGFYWSATAASYSDAIFARNFAFYSDSVFLSNSNNRFSGYSVRCLLKTEQ
jgi:hypothetical protein